MTPHFLSYDGVDMISTMKIKFANITEIGVTDVTTCEKPKFKNNDIVINEVTFPGCIEWQPITVWIRYSKRNENSINGQIAKQFNASKRPRIKLTTKEKILSWFGFYRRPYTPAPDYKFVYESEGLFKIEGAQLCDVKYHPLDEIGGMGIELKIVYDNAVIYDK